MLFIDIKDTVEWTESEDLRVDGTQVSFLDGTVHVSVSSTL